jgi:hypothetical protein
MYACNFNGEERMEPSDALKFSRNSDTCLLITQSSISLLESLESYEHLEYNSIIIIADGTINGSNEPVHQLHSQIGWTYDLANCDAEPISKGDTIGLIEVVEYTSAIPAFCPAVGLTEFELDAHPVTEV